MKSKKKVLLTICCAVVLVVASVMGTMAYLTSQDEVTNTFTVGDVAITLDEADVKTDGTYVTDVSTRVDANEYHLIPGHNYIKDPTVHVDANSEDSWLFVQVDNGLAAIEADTTIAAQMEAKGWTLVAGETNVYAYRDVVSAGEDVVVFNEFTISGDADLADYEDASIVVTAYAVQADGFANAAAAWGATFGK